jgi:hypothetical protein
VIFVALRFAQIGLLASIVLLAVSLARRMRLGVDGAVLARRLRSAPLALVKSALERADGPLALLAPVVSLSEPEDALVALSERALLAERAATAGLAWLRILGMLASALGFAAVAHQISWLQADHGLLDLDPTRVGRIASERAAVALALAVAASGSSVALGSVLRAHARSTLRGINAVRDVLERRIERSRY